MNKLGEVVSFLVRTGPIQRTYCGCIVLVVYHGNPSTSRPAHTAYTLPGKLPKLPSRSHGHQEDQATSQKQSFQEPSFMELGTFTNHKKRHIHHLSVQQLEEQESKSNNLFIIQVKSMKSQQFNSFNAHINGYKELPSFMKCY